MPAVSRRDRQDALDQVEHEYAQQVETGRAERILAIGMVVFMLIGGAWVLNRTAALVPYPDRRVFEDRAGVAVERESVNRLNVQLAEAQRILDERSGELSRALSMYEYTREEYRVGLERGKDDPAVKAAYEKAREAYERAANAAEIARRVRERFALELESASARLQERDLTINREYERAIAGRELKIFVFRAAYALPIFAASLMVWVRARRAGSRYLILATAFLTFGIFQVVLMTLQYSWHLLKGFVQPVLSLVGTLACASALVAIRRYVFNPARTARVRFWKGLCPHCGFPKSAGDHCPSCGGKLTEVCGSCGERRYVDAPYCPHCGAAR